MKIIVMDGEDCVVDKGNGNYVLLRVSGASNRYELDEVDLGRYISHVMPSPCDIEVKDEEEALVILKENYIKKLKGLGVEPITREDLLEWLSWDEKAQEELRKRGCNVEELLEEYERKRSQNR